MAFRSRSVVSTFAVGLLAASSCTQGDIRLEDVDLAGFNFGIPFGISGDGNTVVGSLGSPQTAFSWSALNSETTPLSAPFVQPLGSVASFDGGTLGINGGNNTAYRYRNGSFMSLGPSLDITVCSSDGELLAGRGSTGGWVWSSSNGYQTMPSFSVFGGSSSGSILVGSSNGSAATRASNGTITNLPLPMGASPLLAIDASLDGSVVTGYGSVNGIGRAIRWVNSVPQPLPQVAGFENFNMHVNGMSDDGNVIFGGYSGSGGVPGVWLWTPALGTVNLRTYLQSRGVNVGGFLFLDGMDVSADGHAFTGRYGTGGVFYLRFDTLPIPAPSAAIPLFASALMLGRRRR